MRYTHSIIFSISIVFLLSMMSIFTTLYFFSQNTKSSYYDNILQEYSNSIKKIDLLDININPVYEFDRYFKNDIINDYKQKANIVVDAIYLQESNFDEFNLFLLNYNNKLYTLIKSRDIDILIDTQKHTYNQLELIILSMCVISILVLLYIYIIKRLLPLNILKTKIDQYGNGDFDISFRLDGNDEIANVANSLDTSIKKIDKLLQSRDLFLRNVMHELKTPITKGKILVELLDDEKRKKSLLNVFLRLENMIKEFVFIEQMVAKEFVLDTRECRIVDIIDEAIDITMIDKENFIIDIQSNNKINADFKFLSIAIKNLLDNAIKYSPDKIAFIVIRENEIIFKNRSNELKHNFEHYLQPFVKETHAKSDSFGLGLYIVSSIIKLHNMRLEYEYTGGFSIFKLVINHS